MVKPPEALWFRVVKIKLMWCVCQSACVQLSPLLFFHSVICWLVFLWLQIEMMDSTNFYSHINTEKSPCISHMPQFECNHQIPSRVQYLSSSDSYQFARCENKTPRWILQRPGKLTNCSIICEFAIVLHRFISQVRDCSFEKFSVCREFWMLLGRMGSKTGSLGSL